MQSQSSGFTRSQENVLHVSSTGLPQDGLPSITLSVSPRQSLQRGKCKMDTAKEVVPIGQPELSANCAGTSSISSAAGSLSTAAKAGTRVLDMARSVHKGLERDNLFSSSTSLSQRGWQSKGPQSRAASWHVQRSTGVDSKLPLLQLRAGNLSILGCCT